MVIFITGGIKSGKTSFAINLARKRYKKRCYLATAEPFDDEMKEKIRRHREERKNLFYTEEEPVNVEISLKKIADFEVVVLDCLTTWINNLLYYKEDVERRIIDFVNVVKNINYDLIIISNEVGMGLIPIERMSRDYINYIGVLNQKIAEISDECFFMVSGIPIKIK